MVHSTYTWINTYAMSQVNKLYGFLDIRNPCRQTPLKTMHKLVKSSISTLQSITRNSFNLVTAIVHIVVYSIEKMFGCIFVLYILCTSQLAAISRLVKKRFECFIRYPEKLFRINDQKVLSSLFKSQIQLTARVKHTEFGHLRC